ncbi:MAG: hypothetical protein MK100_06520, partial [Phycisphaerales bacterium]|nr:hypothetical protein [Phycisphaerales bacterium]
MANSDQQEFGQMGRVVRRTAARLRIQHAIDGAGVALGACIAGVACIGLLARWLSIDFSAIGWLVSAAILSSMVLLIRWMQFDLTPIQAASLLDEELKLEEAISTAVHPWPDSEDPFVILHRMHAEDVTSQISVRQAIRLHWPRSWWWPFAAFLVYALVVLVPLDNASDGAPALDMEVARTDTAASIEAVVAQLADSPDLKQSMDQNIALSLPPEANDAATLRRDSLKELTAVE